MKEHIIPYLLSDPSWWCGLNITNHGFDNTSIGIDYYNNNGVLLNTIEMPLKSGCMTRFMVGVPYGWARVLTSDNVTVLEFIGDSKSSFIAPVETWDVIVNNVVPKDKTVVLVEDSQFTEDFCTCPYIAREYMLALKYMARALNYMFPTRKANKLEIVNACPMTNGACPENPAHYADGACVDIHYFTMGLTNHTQAGGNIISIWDGWNLTDSFDKQRNMEFVLMFKSLFPEAIIYMHPIIREALGLAAWNTYGEGARVAVLTAVQPEDTLSMNHHLHAHCNYGGIINRDAKL